MGIKGVTRLLLASLMLFPAAVGWGAEIHGRSSSQLLWYNDFYTGRQVDFTEYLRASITNIDKNGKFSIHGYGRGAQNLNGGEGLTGRLYYLYGDMKELFGVMDARLGRQFVNIGAGSAIIDGGKVDLNKIGPVGFTLFGGRDVIFGLDGELGHEGNYAMGASAYLTGLRNTDLELSWFGKWDEGDMSRELLGVNFKQYLLNSAKVYADARYDVTAEVFNEVLAGIKYFPTGNLVFTGEWYQSYPTFDTTSIYSVFAVNRYQEGVVKVDYSINNKVSVSGGYIRQDYGNDGAGNVYEVGCTVRPIDAVTLDMAYDHRTGYPGVQNGGRFDVSFDATKELQVAAGLAVDAYERKFFPSPSEELTAQKYWVGGKYNLTKSLRASLRLEDEINKTYNSNVQGRFILDYDF